MPSTQMSDAHDPEAILAGLNPEQREAATLVGGPVVILAGAGTGKTRVISHRVAYAVATGAVDERQVLVVSFTNKAADEMSGRLRALGLRRARASTLHSAALAQLSHFWPRVHGSPLPRLLSSKMPLIVPLGRALPGNYRFTPSADLASEIEWAKNRRVTPAEYGQRATAARRSPRVPIDLMARLYADYERAKRRADRLDYEDLLEEAVRLYAADDGAAELVRRRYAWFSVDEYQDTNPLQQALLDAWLGDRRDIGVVGDPNQTIYSFTGADPAFLVGFARRHPGARQVSLVRNYRSTKQVLAIANRLVSGGPGVTLRATSSDGPEPEITAVANEAAELDVIERRIRQLLRQGVAAEEMAILTRTNFQLDPIAQRLRAAGLAFSQRGASFFQSEAVRSATRALGTSNEPVGDRAVAVTERWRRIGFTAGATPDDPEAAERQEALETLLGVAQRFARDHPGTSMRDLVAEFARLANLEAGTEGGGITLSTIHGAKGAEWEAVFVSALEEGSLPIRYAKTPEAIAEEQRLLYVAITRARRHLLLSWVKRRTTASGKDLPQRPSQFLKQLAPRKPPAKPIARSELGSRLPADAMTASAPDDRQQHLFERLAEWRRDRAKRDGTPAYIVAHDAHLRAIAAARPATVEELVAVPGMGTTKADRYGSEILAVVRNG